MMSNMSKWVWVVCALVVSTAHVASAGPIFTVGQSGADYTSLQDALAAVTVQDTTIQFIDSAVYNETSAPSLGGSGVAKDKWTGLTIESAPGQKATINWVEIPSTPTYGLLFGRPNMTLQNVKCVINDNRNAGLLGDGNATNMTVTNVDFVNNVQGSYILGSSPDMTVSYSTFRGYGTGNNDGRGISAYAPSTATLTVDHCSFDNLGMSPIHNGAGFQQVTVTNSAFGNYATVSAYRRGIYFINALTEDYNIYHLANNLAYQEGVGAVPNGPNTLDLPGYSDIFIGDTSAGDWEVPEVMWYAASDGGTIGAWQVPIGDGSWNVDASGLWDEQDNWNRRPVDNTHTATLGDAITSNQTIIVNADATVEGIIFDNTFSYAIAGHGTMNLESATADASLSVVSGNHEFQAKVSLSSNTGVDVAASSTLVFNNALNLGGNTLTKTGDGTVEINNQLTTGGGSVIGLAGTITGGGSVGGDLTNTSATVAPGNSPGTLTVTGNFSQDVGGTLAIELAGTADGEFDVLAVTGSATLGGALDITELYTPGGADTWTILTAGAGITGAFDSITPGYQVALANGDTELVLSLGGALLPGDANGDGCVDDLDLTALAVHWQQSTNLWENGDFNGDGIVDDLDLTALAVNWQQGCGGGGSFADALATANVPEPASAMLVIAGATAVIRRRRKA